MYFWWYGQVVRQWIANPRSPVRIWVPPLNVNQILLHLYKEVCIIIIIVRGCGGIGRHDGLKIRCLVIVREGSSPSIPNLYIISNILFLNYRHL